MASGALQRTAPNGHQQPGALKIRGNKSSSIGQTTSLPFENCSANEVSLKLRFLLVFFLRGVITIEADGVLSDTGEVDALWNCQEDSFTMT